MILFRFSFLHSTQMNAGNLQITCYWVVRGSFIPYLKVFLHSSGLDAVFPDCNSFLCLAIKGLVLSAC